MRFIAINQSLMPEKKNLSIFFFMDLVRFSMFLIFRKFTKREKTEENIVFCIKNICLHNSMIQLRIFVEAFYIPILFACFSQSVQE